MSGKHATVAFLSPNKEVAQQALGGNPLILHDEEFHGLKKRTSQAEQEHRLRLMPHKWIASCPRIAQAVLVWGSEHGTLVTTVTTLMATEHPREGNS